MSATTPELQLLAEILGTTVDNVSAIAIAWSQAKDQAKRINATDLGDLLNIPDNGWKKGNKVNLLLWAAGYIKPNVNNRGFWCKTAKGKDSGLVRQEEALRLTYDPAIARKLENPENFNFEQAKALFESLYD